MSGKFPKLGIDLNFGSERTLLEASAYRITPTHVYVFKKPKIGTDPVQVHIKHANIGKYWDDLVDPVPGSPLSNLVIGTLPKFYKKASDLKPKDPTKTVKDLMSTDDEPKTVPTIQPVESEEGALSADQADKQAAFVAQHVKLPKKKQQLLAAIFKAGNDLDGAAAFAGGEDSEAFDDALMASVELMDKLKRVEVNGLPLIQVTTEDDVEHVSLHPTFASPLMPKKAAISPPPPAPTPVPAPAPVAATTPPSIPVAAPKPAEVAPPKPPEALAPIAAPTANTGTASAPAMGGVLAPPNVPPLSTLIHKGAADKIGGAGAKEWFVDGNGKKYLLKLAAGKSGGGAEPFKAVAQELFSQVASVVRPGKSVPVGIVPEGFKGVPATIQPWLDLGSPASVGKGTDPATLKDSEKQDIAEEHALDWLLSQHDSHGDNLVRRADGSIVSIDKEQGFKYFLGDFKYNGKLVPQDTKLSTDYHPNGVYGETEPYYNKFWRAFADNKMDFDPKSMEGAIKRIEGISDSDYLKLLAKFSATAPFKDDPKKVAQFLQMALDRKKNIRKDFEGFVSELYEKRTKKKGKFTFAGGFVPEQEAAVAPPPAPVPAPAPASSSPIQAPVEPTPPVAPAPVTTPTGAKLDRAAVTAYLNKSAPYSDSTGTFSSSSGGDSIVIDPVVIMSLGFSWPPDADSLIATRKSLATQYETDPVKLLVLKHISEGYTGYNIFHALQKGGLSEAEANDALIAVKKDLSTEYETQLQKKKKKDQGDALPAAATAAAVQASTVATLKHHLANTYSAGASTTYSTADSSVSLAPGVALDITGTASAIKGPAVVGAFQAVQSSYPANSVGEEVTKALASGYAGAQVYDALILSGLEDSAAAAQIDSVKDALAKAYKQQLAAPAEPAAPAAIGDVETAGNYAVAKTVIAAVAESDTINGDAFNNAVKAVEMDLLEAELLASTPEEAAALDAQSKALDLLKSGNTQLETAKTLNALGNASSIGAVGLVMQRLKKAYQSLVSTATAPAAPTATPLAAATNAATLEVPYVSNADYAEIFKKVDLPLKSSYAAALKNLVAFKGDIGKATDALVAQGLDREESERRVKYANKRVKAAGGWPTVGFGSGATPADKTPAVASDIASTATSIPPIVKTATGVEVKTTISPAQKGAIGALNAEMVQASDPQMIAAKKPPTPPGYPDPAPGKMWQLTTATDFKNKHLYKEKPPLNKESQPILNSDFVVLKFNGGQTTTEGIEAYLNQIGVPPTSMPEGNHYPPGVSSNSGYFFALVEKAAWQKALAENKTLAAEQVPIPPPEPVVSGTPKFTTTPKKGQLANPLATIGLAALDSLKESKDIGYGKAFAADGGSLELLGLHMQRYTDSKGEYYRFSFKVRDGDSSLMTGGASTTFKFKKVSYDATTDSWVEGGASVEQSNLPFPARKWSDGASTVHLGTPYGNNQYTAKNMVLADVRPKPGESLTEALRRTLALASPDLADKVLKDPTEADVKRVKLSSLLWSLAPQASDALTDTQRTPEALLESLNDFAVAQALLKATNNTSSKSDLYSNPKQVVASITKSKALSAEAIENIKATAIKDMQDKINSIRLEETGVGQISPVLPGRHKTLRDDQKVALINYGVDFSTDSIVSQVLGGSISIRQKLQIGVPPGKSSVALDFNTGGADYVFTKPITDSKGADYSYYGSAKLLYDPSELDRLDCFIHTSDYYGVTNPEAATGHAWKDRSPLEKAVGSASEICFKQGISSRKLLKIAVDSAAAAAQLIKALKAKGITEVNGMTPEELVYVKTDAYADYKALCAPAGY